MLPFSVQWPLYTNVGPSRWITWWCPKQNLVVNTCWWEIKVPRQMGTFNLKGKFEIGSCSSKIWTIPFSGSSSPHLQSFSQPYKKIISSMECSQCTYLLTARCWSWSLSKSASQKFESRYGEDTVLTHEPTSSINRLVKSSGMSS